MHSLNIYNLVIPYSIFYNLTTQFEKNHDFCTNIIYQFMISVTTFFVFLFYQDLFCFRKRKKQLLQEEQRGVGPSPKSIR